jgi:hypothetical protein
MRRVLRAAKRIFGHVFAFGSFQPWLRKSLSAVLSESRTILN